MEEYRGKYTSITFRKDLAKLIDERIKDQGFGSRCEFIKFCVQKELRRTQGE